MMLEPACHAAHRGVPCARQAPGGYCLPPRCYCGSCPWFVPIEVRATYTPDSFTAYDRAAIISPTGRRANLAQYRAAQAAAKQQEVALMTARVRLPYEPRPAGSDDPPRLPAPLADGRRPGARDPRPARQPAPADLALSEPNATGDQP